MLICLNCLAFIHVIHLGSQIGRFLFPNMKNDKEKVDWLIWGVMSHQLSRNRYPLVYKASVTSKGLLKLFLENQFDLGLHCLLVSLFIIYLSKIPP